MAVIETVEDPFFDPEAATIRDDEKLCTVCNYVHYIKLSECPTCKLNREGK